MARLSITNDTVARLCYEYMHGQLEAKTNEKIYAAACEVVGEKDAFLFVFEIAYRLGPVVDRIFTQRRLRIR